MRTCCGLLSSKASLKSADTAAAPTLIWAQQLGCSALSPTPPPGSLLSVTAVPPARALISPRVYSSPPTDCARPAYWFALITCPPTRFSRYLHSEIGFRARTCRDAVFPQSLHARKLGNVRWKWLRGGPPHSFRSRRFTRSTTLGHSNKKH